MVLGGWNGDVLVIGRCTMPLCLVVYCNLGIDLAGERGWWNDVCPGLLVVDEKNHFHGN